MPKNTGNCQWCAFEGLRALLMGEDVREIPSYSEDQFDDGIDPADVFIRKAEDEGMPQVYRPSQAGHKRERAFDELKRILKAGEALLVSLDAEDISHAYSIYNFDGDIFLIDQDRQIVKPLQSHEDFIVAVVVVQ